MPILSHPAADPTCEVRSLVGLSFSLGFALWLLTTPACAQASEPTVRFTGPVERAVVQELRVVASFATAADMPAAEFLLKRRAQEYMARLEEILASHGFYAARLQVSIQGRDSNRPEVVYDVDPGPVYRISDVELRITTPEGVTPPSQPSLADLGIGPDDVATAPAMRSARNRLQKALHRQGHAFASADMPVVRVDHDSRTVQLVLSAAAGPLVQFGATTVSGLNRVDETFVRKEIPWAPGEQYDPEEIERLRKRLFESELFSLIRIQGGVDEAQPVLPMEVELKEADPRTVSAGIGYETDRGAGLKLAWEHRNLRGGGERLRLKLGGYVSEQTVDITYRKPHFRRPNQALLPRLTLTQEDTDAYDSRSVTAGIHVARDWTRSLTTVVGLAATGIHETAQDDTSDYVLVSLPVSLEWDRRDDLLDPRSGWRLSGGYTPFKEVVTGDRLFHKAVVTARGYLPLTRGLVLAGRATVGTIVGEDTDDIPADERFYAGGGGSIRGYPYQEIGPQTDGDPSGGRSLLELSAELRWRMSETVGVVIFADGGNAFTELLSDVDGTLYWGTGLGIRYYTPVGPLRLDVAVPVDKPDYVDSSFQLYISFGQAF